ncbi:MAG: type II secretion system secretin GspD [Hydrogenophilales bacterium]|nr:type II secretion system secretin GspD [Hydrogenophilales bacterium]
MKILRIFCIATYLLVSGGLFAAEPVGKGSVNLDFANADIIAVIQAIGQMTGRNIVVDPRVKGTLTLTTQRPVSKSVAYDLLLSALRLQGFAAVQSGGVVRVVPEAEAKFYAVPVNAKRHKGMPSGQVVSRVFQLKHESASQLVSVLRPLVTANNVISADTVGNSLVVTDYAENVARLAQIIESLDVPGVGEPVILPLKYASAQEVANLLGRVFGTGMAGAAVSGIDPQRVEVAVDVRSNSLVVRTDNPSRLSRVQNLVSSLDVPTPVAGNVHVVYLKNAEAAKVAQTLRNILSGDTSVATAEVKTAATGTQNTVQNTATVAASGAGMVQADSATNALIITAPDAVFNNLKTVVEQLDVRRAQVLVEALIAEVTADKAAEFGIQWMSLTGLSDGSSSVIGGFGNSSSTSNIGVVAANPASAAKGFNLGLVDGTVTIPGIDGAIANLGLLARALETNANANILSTPTLLALDNEEAKISIGANVPFQTGQYQLTGSSASPFQTIERKDVGLTLKVKPMISEGGTVRLQIYQEVSKLRSSDNVTLATTDKRSLESTVLVDDGQIIVLGGLIEDSIQDIEDKVPLLGDIPWLGHLFRYDTRKQTKTNLMVFLRPVIVRTAADAAGVTHPRYDYIAGQQKASAPRSKPLLPDINAPSLSLEMSPGLARTQKAP